jgi:hypothetical protein
VFTAPYELGLNMQLSVFCFKGFIEEIKGRKARGSNQRYCICCYGEETERVSHVAVVGGGQSEWLCSR